MSTAEARHVAQICDVLNAVIAERETYLARHGLDPGVALPGGIEWGGVGGWGGSFASLRRKAMPEIALFRAIGSNFNDRSIVIYQDERLSPQPDRWIHLFQRLTAICGDRWTVRMPVRFGEIGWDIDGHPVNVQTAYFQETMTLMCLTGVTDALERRVRSAPLSVFEIGGGFGQMAWILCGALPGTRWFACDLPESLIHQTVYMAVCRPEKRHVIYVGDMPLKGIAQSGLIVRDAREAVALGDAVVSIPNFLIDDFIGPLTVDLAINVESFSEMAIVQVEHYGSLVSRILSPTGMFFEQNGDHRSKLGGNWCKEHLAASFAARLDGSTLLDQPIRVVPRRGQPDVWANSAAALPEPLFRIKKRVVEALAERSHEIDLDFDAPQVGEVLQHWWQAEEAKPSRGWFGKTD